MGWLLGSIRHHKEVGESLPFNFKKKVKKVFCHYPPYVTTASSGVDSASASTSASSSASASAWFAAF